MTSIVDLAGVAGAVAVSLAIAVGLEWLSLRALMHLMPGKPAPVSVGGDAMRQTGQRKAA